MKKWIVIAILAVAAPAFSQTAVHKCPAATPGAPPIFQQLPCSPTGGGEIIQVKPLQSTGTTLELTDQGKKFLKENQEQREKQAAQEQVERERQEALAAEHRKARAAEAQAAAQRATAAAIWNLGYRR